MTIFPEFERELVELASGPAAGSAAPRRARLMRWSRFPQVGVVAAVASVVVAMAVGGFFLISLHAGSGSGGPGPGASGGSSLPPKGWLKADEAAQAHVRRRDPVCGPLQPLETAPSPQHLLETPPASKLRAVLGVFEQPAPDSQRVSPQRLHSLGVPAQGIYIRYIRHGRQDGVDYYLIPAENVLLARPLPDRCFSERLAAFRGVVAHLPATRRAEAINYEEQHLRTARQLNRRPLAGVCLVAVARGIHDRMCLPTELFAEASPPRSPGLNTGGGNRHLTVTVLAVPNGVASVTAHYPVEHRVGNVPAPVTITHRVVDNVVVFRLNGGWDPPALTYRSARGLVIAASP